ncbi:hypothetical protein EV215_2043 [Hypnocyclicus thermotrophus]|uniref:Uncharacterized protein n=1 Tax=Hypnocyclicus thermotrophus TaxID=1627895 RepID=A0AA46DX25_9FUSO|nr:hypothetical protein [Hypnocyclicus thermotrophus]TDT67365.1 hypothetical protein EV215_2043 [Hypnocyclicus thermotrophus]
MWVEYAKKEIKNILDIKKLLENNGFKVKEYYKENNLYLFALYINNYKEEEEVVKIIEFKIQNKKLYRLVEKNNLFLEICYCNEKNNNIVYYLKQLGYESKILKEKKDEFVVAIEDDEGLIRIEYLKKEGNMVYRYIK